jgi:sugar O-acyltransferase (sialic acid O-acetyltransferase NeuD family)
MNFDPQKTLVFIGAGGHAHTLLDALALRGVKPVAYVDPVTQPWIEALGVAHISERELTRLLPSKPQLVVGFVGLTPDALQHRLQTMQVYHSQGAELPAIIHPSAVVSQFATVAAGAHIGAGALVNAAAAIGMGAVINTGAIVEHDARIGSGAHIAPGAAVLGDATVGDCAFIGSQALVVQGSNVSPRQFVKAQTVHK